MATDRSMGIRVPMVCLTVRLSSLCPPAPSSPRTRTRSIARSPFRESGAPTAGLLHHPFLFNLTIAASHSGFTAIQSQHNPHPPTRNPYASGVGDFLSNVGRFKIIESTLREGCVVDFNYAVVDAMELTVSQRAICQCILYDGEED